MTPEKLFHQLLGLGSDWEVTQSRFETSSGIVYLEIQETSRLWESARCPKDKGPVFCYDHTETLSWRHLNIFQHRCEITCRLPRAKCRHCGRVFRVEPPWEGLSGHFSKEFEAYALLLLREMPVAKVGEITEPLHFPSLPSSQHGLGQDAEDEQDKLEGKKSWFLSSVRSGEILEVSINDCQDSNAGWRFGSGANPLAN